MSETLQQAIQGATLLVLPNASHLGAVEQPALFASAVAGFIAGL